MPTTLWKGTIQVGLVRIPISLKSAAQHRPLKFHLLDQKDLSPISVKRVNRDTGREIPAERIVRGFEYAKGKHVLVTDEDLREAAAHRDHRFEVLDFVSLHEVDPLFYEKPYYVVPEPGGEKGYLLLRRTLQKLKRGGVGQVIIHGKEHLAMIFPKGEYIILEILRYAHEVREAFEAEYLKEADFSEVRIRPEEQRAAETLVQEMTAPWEPERYGDTYYQNLSRRIESKVKGRARARIAAVEETEEELTQEGVVDLLPLLERSAERKRAV